METASKAGFPVVGVIFLALAGWNFMRGENWVVWVVLGVLLGGLAAFRAKKRGAE